MEKFVVFMKKFFQCIFAILKFVYGLLKGIFKFFKALFTGNIVDHFSNLFYHKRKLLQQRLKESREHDPEKKSAPTVKNDKFTNRAPKRTLPEKGRTGIDKFKNQRTNDIKSKAENKGTAGKDLHLKKKKSDDGSFADRSKHNLSKYIYLVTGQDKGRDAWHYVLVDPPKLQVFRAKTQGGSLDVADYGKVLYSGWGKTPPEDIKEKIKDEYLSPEARKREDEYELNKKEEEELAKKAENDSNNEEASNEDYNDSELNNENFEDLNEHNSQKEESSNTEDGNNYEDEKKNNSNKNN